MNRFGALSIVVLAAIVPTAAQAYDWTGFYAGVYGGASNQAPVISGSGSSDVVLPPFGFMPVAPAAPVPTFVPGMLATATFAASGGGGGLGPQAGFHAGYLWQKDSFVYGVEASVGGSPGSGAYTVNGPSRTWGPDTNVVGATTIIQTMTGTISVTGGIDVSLRGRAGVAVDQMFYYLTAGLSVRQANVSSSFTTETDFGATTPLLDLDGTGPTTTRSVMLAGGTLGLGAEYAIDENLRIGAEYRFTQYTSGPATLGTTFAGDPVTGSIGFGSHYLGARISWHPS